MESLVVKGITKIYRDKKAVEDISFSIHRGQIIGLLGPNGAGKTTTMSIITGILAADKGEVLFDDKPMTAEDEIKIKQKIGFLSESNPLYEDMLVSEYLDFVASLRGMEKEEKKKAIERVVKETGIEDKFHQPIEELSKGYKQRVGLAQAILHQPELLILDEPTEGLDPNQRVTIRNLIQSVGKDRTVIISTHVLSEVQSMCDQVIILNEGRLLKQGTVDEVIQAGKKGQKIRLEIQGDSVIDRLKEKNFEIVEHQSLNGREVIAVLSLQEGDARPRLFDLCKEQNWKLYELHQEQASLEDTFRSLTINEAKS